MIKLKYHLYLFAYLYDTEFHKLHISILYEKEARENDSERTIRGSKTMEITRE